MYCGLLMFGFWTSSTRLCTWALKCALKFKTISIVLQMVIIELVWRNMQNMRKRDGKSTVKWPQKTKTITAVDTSIFSVCLVFFFAIVMLKAQILCKYHIQHCAYAGVLFHLFASSDLCSFRFTLKSHQHYHNEYCQTYATHQIYGLHANHVADGLI